MVLNTDIVSHTGVVCYTDIVSNTVVVSHTDIVSNTDVVSCSDVISTLFLYLVLTWSRILTFFLSSASVPGSSSEKRGHGAEGRAE